MPPSRVTAGWRGEGEGGRPACGVVRMYVHARWACYSCGYGIVLLTAALRVWYKGASCVGKRSRCTGREGDCGEDTACRFLSGCCMLAAMPNVLPYYR